MCLMSWQWNRQTDQVVRESPHTYTENINIGQFYLVRRINTSALAAFICTCSPVSVSISVLIFTQLPCHIMVLSIVSFLCVEDMRGW